MSNSDKPLAVPLSEGLGLTADDVQWLVSDWSKTYLVRGHVEPAAILAAVREYGEEAPENFSAPTHAWWRTFPKWVDGERMQWFQHAEPNARGAFRCTVMSKSW